MRFAGGGADGSVRVWRLWTRSRSQSGPCTKAG